MTIAEYIERTLSVEGSTKTWLAELLNITKQQLNYRFNNDSFSANELILISKALNFDLEEMKEDIERGGKMKVITTLARNARTMEEIEQFDDGFGFTKVYGIETESQILKIWNSSNHKKFDHQAVLQVIADEMVKGKESGTFDDGNLNYIMWELVEKR